MSKDYSSEKHLTLGHLSHEQLAAKLLNQNRSSEELMSVCRAGHDRIMHFVQRAINDIQVDPQTAALAAQLEEVQVTSGGVPIVSDEEQKRRELAYEHNQAQAKIDSLSIEAAAAQANLANAEQAATNIGQQLAEAQAKLAEQATALAEAQAKVEAQAIELTTAYMAKSAAEQNAQQLQAQLDDIRENYDIVDGEDDGDEEGGQNESTGQQEESAPSYYKPSRDELREIAVAHGFRVRKQPNGEEDLNEYVFDTMYDGIKLSHEKTQH